MISDSSRLPKGSGAEPTAKGELEGPSSASYASAKSFSGAFELAFLPAFLRHLGYIIGTATCVSISHIGVSPSAVTSHVARKSGAGTHLLARRSGFLEGRLGFGGSCRAKLATLFVLAVPALFAACGEERAEGGGEVETREQASGEAALQGMSDEARLTPAEATVGPNEETAMPAGGKAEDPDQAPPKDPPEGVRTYPASTNRNLSGSITYDQDPPINGDHAPYWQNCGFYSSPVENEAAVHSLDHGAVWVTYRPDLPNDQVDILRDIAREDYVLVSPYPGLSAPVVATAWRNQLTLEDAEDPRLRQFVDQFRVSQTAPRSGNGCTGGRGQPET